MASADVLGAPGLPGGAMSFYAPNLSRDSLKRSYSAFAASDEMPTECSHFDPEKHLAFEAPAKVHTLADIGLSADCGISPVAVSEPFRLFSKEAVMEMRKEILADKVMNEYSYTSDIAPKQLRGYAPKYGLFLIVT